MAEPGKQPARSPPRPALEAPEAVPGRGCFPLGDLAWRRSWGHPSDETAAKRAQVRGRYPLGRLPTWGNAPSRLLGAEGVEGRTPWAGDPF